MSTNDHQNSHTSIPQVALQRRLDESLKEGEIQKKIDNEIATRLPRLVGEEVKKSLNEMRSALRSESKQIADESFENLRQKIEKDRLNTIQATSIVTIFIGFLVVQFNILQGSESAKKLAGLSLILLASIIIFTLLIDLVIKLDLPYKKTRVIKGVNSGGLAALARLMGGDRKEEIPLDWRPSTWGEGLIIRAVAVTVALTLGLIGVLLVAL